MNEEDVPVLTEVVDDAPIQAARSFSTPDASVPTPSASIASGPALEALASELEQALLERLTPQMDRLFEQARSELSGRVGVAVREALVASLAEIIAKRH